jgi:hypothetical protein
LYKKNSLVYNPFEHWYSSFFFGRGFSRKGESSKGTYTGGAYITFQYSSAISFRTGLVLISNGEKGIYSYTAYGDSIVITTGKDTGNGKGNNGNGLGNNGNGKATTQNTTTSTSGTISYINTNYYLSIPVMIGYTVRKNEWMFSGFSGIGAGFLLIHSSKYPDGKGKNIEGKEPYSLTATYKKQLLIFPSMVEVNYKIHDKWGIAGAFSFTYFASSIYAANTPVRPFHLGALLGITYFPTK